MGIRPGDRAQPGLRLSQAKRARAKKVLRGKAKPGAGSKVQGQGRCLGQMNVETRVGGTIAAKY